MKRLVALMPPTGFGVALLLGWEIICRAFGVPRYLIPTPTEIAAAFLAEAPSLIVAALTTLRTAAEAMALAAVAAIGLAVACNLSRLAGRAIRPITSALQVTPVVAIAPLFVIWAGVDHPGRALVSLASIVAFFPLFSGALAGLDSADPNLEQLFDLYRSSDFHRLVWLRIPAALPFLLEGFKVAAGLAIVGAVVAEFVAGSGADQGLAWRILEAGNHLRTDAMFAALATLSALAVVLNALLGRAQRQLLRWWRG